MKTLLIERNRYFDSVFLMRISAELELLDGIDQAVVAMATPVNVENLEKSGFELSSANLSPADLVIAIDAHTDEVVGTARTKLKELLAGGTDTDDAATQRPATLEGALRIDPNANLALISVPGMHAAREARNALRRGLHVMLFSDNVSVEDEIALKDEAVARGLLLMGPDCGTAILNGAPLGFANVCRRGSIGIVGASGTGIQEISSLIHQQGGGISQAIGTGGRDLSAEVGARMTRFGIEALAVDPTTEVIVVVSKAPAACVIPGILETLKDSGKPCVVQFVGWNPDLADPAWLEFPAQFASTLAEAARLAIHEAKLESLSQVSAVQKLPPVDGAVLGLFCGGTLCQEAWSILSQAGWDVVSNVAFDPEKKVRADAEVTGHAVWDLGDDMFTVGKPHPMIEPSLRDEKVAAAGEDPSIGLVLVDCVIGYGAHEDPGLSLAAAARSAIRAAEGVGRKLRVLASVTGTDEDPQVRRKQQQVLEAAGVIVAPSNDAAARLAIQMTQGVGA